MKLAFQIKRRIQATIWKRYNWHRVHGACPRCQTVGCYYRCGTYKRHLRLWICGTVVVIYLVIPRLECRGCPGAKRHTHAILGPGIIPYRWYALQFIQRVIAEHCNKHWTVKATAHHFEIGESTIWAWEKIAADDLQLLYGVIHRRVWLLANIMKLAGYSGYLKMLQSQRRVLFEHLR